MARSFNGTSDVAKQASAAVSNSIFTISAWAFPTDDTAVRTVGALAVASGTDFQRLFFWGSQAGKPIGFQSSAHGGTQGIASTSTSMTNNAWQHVAGWVNGANSRAVYLNGGGKGTNSTNVTGLTGPTQMDIGANENTTTNEFFKGNLAEFTVWNVVLTDNEIAALATGINSYLVRPLSIVAYYPLYGLASPEVDFSGVAKNMTLTGTALANHAPVTLWTPKPPLFAPIGVSGAAATPWCYVNNNLPVLGTGTY